MGADGGICWVITSDEERFKHLLGPWIGFIQGSGSDIGDDSRWEYEKENTIPGYSAPYGTDLSDVQLARLPSFMYDIEGFIEEKMFGIEMDSTFKDLLLERKTRPMVDSVEQYVKYRYFHLPKWLDILEFIVLHYPVHLSFLDMEIGNWIRGLDAIWSDRRVDCVETWT